MAGGTPTHMRTLALTPRPLVGVKLALRPRKSPKHVQLRRLPPQKQPEPTMARKYASRALHKTRLCQAGKGRPPTHYSTAFPSRTPPLRRMSTTIGCGSVTIRISPASTRHAAVLRHQAGNASRVSGSRTRKVVAFGEYRDCCAAVDRADEIRGCVGNSLEMQEAPVWPKGRPLDAFRHERLQFEVLT